jgi:outer membrane protein TolC
VEPYIEQVYTRFSEDDGSVADDAFAVEATSLKDDPWWEKQVATTQRGRAEPVFVDVQSLIISAVRHSHDLQAQSNFPLIREDQIIEEDAAFDTHAFMESKFSKISEPVGNSLTTGPDLRRLRDSIWDYSAGIRKRTYKGGRLELAQEVGYEDSNSDFFLPTQQGTARLTLRFQQPLLRGAGRLYNTSLIMLATIDSRIAWAEFQMELQNYLLQVSDAYWDLYLQRASLLQKQRNLQRAAEILEELENRAEIDAAESQVIRARAALAARESDLARAAAEVRNIEARIRALVNDPTLLEASRIEFVPTEPPIDEFIPVSTSDALVTALQNRPEIDKALEQIRSGRLHIAVSEKELLPILDAITETYVTGLQGASDVGGAWVDQFSKGEPSYAVGLEFSIPLQNRAAKARLHRKRLQLKTLLSRYRSTVETLISEVEVAVREVQTLYKESRGKHHAMAAAQAELDALTERWRLLPGDDRSASFLLEDILGAQDRLLGQEYDYASARVAYAQSLMNLKRVTGTLLESEQISISRACECDMQQLMLDKLVIEHPSGGVLPFDPAELAAPEPAVKPAPFVTAIPLEQVPPGSLETSLPTNSVPSE